MAERRHPVTGHEGVDDGVARDMAPLHERAVGSHLNEVTVRLLRGRRVVDIAPGQDGGFVGVRRDDRRFGDEGLVSVFASAASTGRPRPPPSPGRRRDSAGRRHTR